MRDVATQKPDGTASSGSDHDISNRIENIRSSSFRSLPSTALLTERRFRVKMALMNAVSIPLCDPTRPSASHVYKRTIKTLDQNEESNLVRAWQQRRDGRALEALIRAFDPLITAII
jgi:hypothetical protein